MSTRNIGLGLLDTAVKLCLIVAAISVISKYASLAYRYGYNIYNQVPASPYDTRTVTVSVTNSMSVMDIAELLENRGIIEDKLLFYLQERFSEYHGLIAPGTYVLSPSQTADEIIAVMSESTIEAEEAGESQ